MKQLSLYMLMLCGLFCSSQLTGQLSVQNGSTATQLGNNLAGSNIAVTNATITGNPNQYGTFQFVGNGLGLNSGVILSTGDIFDAIGPNSSGATSTDYNRPGDADLTALAGFNTNDAVVFQFDFEVQGDEIEFNFVFLSEEYNEFVGTQFNDVFAFYISGPGIVGQQNIAVVPTTTTPVTINSINNGSFWQFYRDNTGANPVNIEFDGFTTLMTAHKDGLQQCGVYTLSLRIADGGDGAYDSGVLLQENSLVQNNVSATSYTYSGNSVALEGCIDASFTFNLDTPAVTAVQIPVQVAGTALNGVDFVYIDTLITIPVGQSSATVIIEALSDGITEGQEVVELIFSPNPCAAPDTVRLYIDDSNPIQFSLNGTDLGCHHDASGIIDATISGGFPPYIITVTDSATGSSSTYPASALPISGFDAGTYIVGISDLYGCEAEALVLGGSFNAGQTFLPDGTGVSYTSAINISGFNAGQTINSISQINAICATMEHSYANDLTIVLQAPNGQTVMLKDVGPTGGAVNACNLGEPVASGPVDSWNGTNITPGIGYQYCWNNNPIYPSMNAMISTIAPGPPPQYTYTTQAGNTYTDYYLPPGSYTPIQPLSNLIGAPMNGTWTLIVTDNYSLDNGYIFDWSISLVGDLPDSILRLEEPDSVSFASTNVSPSCGASDGSINLSVTGDHTPFSFAWSNGANTEDLSNVAAGSYVVSVTDTTGCVYTHTVSLSNNGAVAMSVVIGNETCVGSNNGSINLTLGGGTAPFSYIWSNGATTQDINTLSPGSYSVSVTDAGTCLGVNSYTVSAAVPLSLSASITQENCGDREGIVDITVQGGTGPYTYIWSNGATTQDIDNLQQGYYSVIIRDVNFCSINDTFQVINLVGGCLPSCDLAITNSNVNDEACGNAGGSISLTTFTTHGPTQFNWSNGATSEDLIGLSAGTYTVSITDNEGCTLTQSYSLINQTGGLTISAMNLSNEYCGNGQGAIDAVISGGAQPYNYLWSNGATTQDLTGLAAGNYALTVTDANGCAYSNQNTVVNNTGNFTQTYGNATNSVCGQNNGSIDINFSGGQNPIGYLWSNGAITQDITGLAAGTYTCTATDAGGCKIITQVYTVGNGSQGFSISFIDTDNEVCNNDAGAIQLSLSGGAAPFTYIWNTGNTTATLSGLSAGTYTGTVTASNGCFVTTGNISLINESGSLALSGVNSFDENCGNATGSIDLNITGGTSPISYNWNTGSNSQDLSNLSAGNYNCTITDINGCQVFAGSNISNNPGALSIDNFIVSDVTCTQTTGSINSIISGAASPAVYQWSNGGNTPGISNIAAGNYSLTVTDANGCSTTGNASVNNNTGSLALSNAAVSNEVCNNSNASIDLTIAGNNTPFSYLWSNGATTEDLTGLSAGAYSATVTDTGGCALVVGPYTINNSAGTLSASTTSVTDETCGNTAGAINISVGGGTAPYSFLWSNATTTEDLTGLSAGTYTVTITDNGGCSRQLSANVANNSGGLAISNAAITDVLCSNNGGSIDITVSGGTGPYSYAWSNAANTEDISALAPGSYQVTVTGSGGCSTVQSYTVNNNSGNFQLGNITVQNENCGNGTGLITVSLNGGVPPIAFNWNSGQITQNISGLNAGVYEATATDNNGCVLTYSATILNNSGTLNVSSVAVTDELCGAVDGAIDITVAGGTAPFSYQWSNAATTEDLSGLNGGTYTCVISDAGGCSSNFTTTVNDLGGNLQITNIQVTNDICNNALGSISITPTGGTGPYTYSWGTQTPIGCCNYYLEMNDQAGNGWGTQFVTVFLNGISLGNFAATGFQSIQSFSFCTGDIVRLEYTRQGPGGTSNWFYFMSSSDTLYASGQNSPTGVVFNQTLTCSAPSGTTNLSNLSANTYLVTVTDANGCDVSANISLTNSNGSLQIANATVTDENCSQVNGSIDLTVNGSNPTISWNTGATSTDLFNIGAGLYIVSISDANGCTILDTFVVVNNANGMTNSATVVDENCSNLQGSIDITPLGGNAPYSYNWSTGANTQDIGGLNAGNYSVTITDNTGCSFIDNYTITNITNGMNASANVTNETCGNNGGIIDLSVSGGTGPYTYSWSNGSNAQDIILVPAGIYTVTITDNSGCAFIYSDTVLNGSGTLAISNAVVNDAFCGGNDGNIDLSVTGGINPITYQWSNGASTQDLINLAPGTYSVTVTSSSGCTVSNSYTINNNAFFTITNAVITATLCGNSQGGVDLTVQGGFGLVYTWSNGANTQDISGVASGTYSVTISSGGGPGGCFQYATYTVPNNNGTIAADSLGISNETCGSANGSITLLMMGGTSPYSYNWNTGSTAQTLSNLSAGIYSVTVTDAGGCQYIDSVTLQNNSFGFGVSNSSFSDENCNDGMGSISMTISGGTVPYTYLWSNGATTEDLTGLSAGTYTVTMTDATSCSVMRTFTINNLTNGLTATGTATSATCNGNNGSINLTTSSGQAPYTYLWSNGATTEDLTGVAAGTYSVTVSDAAGCSFLYSNTIGNNNVPVTISNLVISNVSCSGCTDGAINLTMALNGMPYTYQWSNGATTEDISGLGAGNYTVTITNNAGCTLVTNLTVSTNTGVQHISNFDFNLYPNPTRGRVYLDFGIAPTEDLKIEVFNALGQIVRAQNYSAGTVGNVLPLELDNHVSGMFLVRVTLGSTTVVKRVELIND